MPQQSGGNMNKQAKRVMGRHWIGVAALCCTVGAAAAQAPVAAAAAAGPVKDTALADREFARGDLAAALPLWRRAADQGYAPAQARLGDILDKSEEDEEAVAWYRKAALQNNADGEFGLGQMYAKGEGVPKDLVQAQAHLLRAAKMDHTGAINVLMQAYRSGGLGLAPDPVQAASWEARLVALEPVRKAAPKVAEKGKRRDAK
jgi:TPR repeat protein